VIHSYLYLIIFTRLCALFEIMDCITKITIIICVLISGMQRCNAFLNCYLSLSEVHRFLGLEMELYYVRDGIVNEKALNFEVPVPSKIDTIYFTWQNSGKVDRPMPYTIGIEVLNTIAMGTPKLNISSSGTIPTTVEVFSITLPCTGVVTADVDVHIQLNYTTNAGVNVRSLTFHRKKVCLKMESHSNNHIFTDSNLTTSNSTNIFYTAIGCAITLICLLLSICVSINFKNKNMGNQAENMLQTHNAYLTAAPRNTTAASSYGSFCRMPSYSFIEERSNDVQDHIAELKIQRSKVRLGNVILEGTFGRVYIGSYVTDDGKEEDVIIKTVADHASQIQIALLLKEGMSMYSLSHPSIYSILGVSIEDNTPPLLLYPYKSNSNMKLFLQRCKSNVDGVAHTITTQEVVDMALRVISAMQYLHKKHLLHKDLATRNCMIDDKLNVQLADNALSRDLFPADYYCLGDNENRPVKWLAIESLLHKTFSTSSDVWSFGVLLWELMTLAQQPYVEIDPFEMAAYLKDGYRLAQPINCPDELFAVMAYCWAMSPDERPTFSQLQVCLQEFYAQLIRYV